MLAPKWPVLYIPWIYLIILYYLLDIWLFHLHYYEQPCGKQPYMCPWFTFLSSPFTKNTSLASAIRMIWFTTYCVFHLSSICTYDLDTLILQGPTSLWGAFTESLWHSSPFLSNAPQTLCPLDMIYSIYWYFVFNLEPIFLPH